ncbi:hypothetical protein ACHAXR_006418 [Thalassiosira sp. AJA248-18]
MHGRKRALVFSLFCMSVPTVAMGLLPTYEQVGWLSTALLVLCRLLQGFSVGGQLPSSVVYTLETKPKEHWGYYGSMICFANGIGSILGNLVGALLRTLLTDDQLVQWGWRVAFVSGVFILPVAIFLHLYGREHHPNEGEYDSNEETVDDQDIVSSISSSLQQHRPLKEALRRENMPALFASFLTPMLLGAGYYITFVWMAIFMETLIDPPVAGAFWVNLLAALCGHYWTAIVAGWLSDRYGRDKLMVAGAVSVGTVAPVMVWIISWGRTVDAFFAQWAIGVLLSLFTGPLLAWLIEKFPPKARLASFYFCMTLFFSVRLTSVSFGYNLGLCLSAGFSPAVATALVHAFGPVAPGAIYPFFAILALIGMFISTKFHREEREKYDVLGEEIIPQSDFIYDPTVPLLL